MREDGPATIGGALLLFLEDCMISGKAESTVYSYGRKLRGRLDLAAPVSSLDSRACRTLMAAECRRTSLSTARSFRAPLGAFCTWAVGMGYLAVNPALGLPTPRVPEGPSRALSERQVEALFGAARDGRELLMLRLFLSTGCRRSEIAGAMWADVDWEKGCLTVLKAKGGRPRRVSLDDETLNLLRAKYPPNTPLSTPLLGWTSKALYWQFKQLAKRAGLPRLHPHQMRHTYFTDSIRRGMSPLAAQTLGGWSDQRMLLRYAAASVEDAALAEARRFGR